MLNIHEQTIFIVDDEELILKSTERILKILGCEDVRTFNNGQDCVNALNQDPFLILLDYQMDDLNGFDVLRKIKRYNPNTYVIIMSGQSDIANAVDTLKFGAFDYIVKGDNDTAKLQMNLDRIFKLEENILAPRKSLFSRLFNFL
ncbi:MAG: DNA-binding NtrC family response regulator [Bacteroidia bacterium]|jgi:DNA-binding NtrC family response regulator